MLDATRRGPRAPYLVSREVRDALAEGAPSVNHMEQIALDMGALLENSFPALAARSADLREAGLVTRMRRGGEVLLAGLDERSWAIAAGSESDTVRGWGAMAVGAADGLEMQRRLALIRPFADDPHFAVREWAWLALRPHVIADLPVAIELLSGWTRERSPELRRFASEATRPRGVWSRHIPELKLRPQLGLPILAPLSADPSRYVQDSVGNWLNDASRSSPEWVRQICQRWSMANRSPRTERICRRALRTVRRG